MYIVELYEGKVVVLCYTVCIYWQYKSFLILDW
jgi:hypothetical protein